MLFAPTPAARSSSSDSVDDRFLAAPQVSPKRRHRDSAPGNLPAIPTTAIALGGSEFGVDEKSILLSHALSSPSAAVRLRWRAAARCCARSRTCVGRSPVLLGQAELTDEIDREVSERGALQQECHRRLHAEVPANGVSHPHRHQRIHTQLGQRHRRYRWRRWSAKPMIAEIRLRSRRDDDPVGLGRIQLPKRVGSTPVVVGVKRSNSSTRFAK